MSQLKMVLVTNSALEQSCNKGQLRSNVLEYRDNNPLARI